MKLKTKVKHPVTQRIFTSGQASKVAGIPYHTVNYWAKTGLLVPKTPARGSSTCRGYSFSDLVAMRVAAKLKRAGIGTKGLKSVINFLTEHGYRNTSNAYLLIAHNGKVTVVGEEKLVASLGCPGEVFSVFAIGNEVAELSKEANALESPVRGKTKLVTG